ncbi:hypothetical protein P3T24_006196 [Paraburkholderia sp. GAS33]|jgi:hypothetical protein
MGNGVDVDANEIIEPLARVDDERVAVLPKVILVGNDLF